MGAFGGVEAFACTHFILPPISRQHTPENVQLRAIRLDALPIQHREGNDPQVDPIATLVYNAEQSRAASHLARRVPISVWINS